MFPDTQMLLCKKKIIIICCASVCTAELMIIYCVLHSCLSACLLCNDVFRKSPSDTSGDFLDKPCVVSETCWFDFIEQTLVAVVGSGDRAALLILLSLSNANQKMPANKMDCSKVQVF